MQSRLATQGVNSAVASPTDFKLHSRVFRELASLSEELHNPKYGSSEEGENVASKRTRRRASKWYLEESEKVIVTTKEPMQ